MSTCGSPLFTSLQISEKKARWEFFAVSYSVQTLGLAALLVFSVLAPKIAPPLLEHIELVAPNLDPMPMAKAAPVKPVVRPVVKVAAIQLPPVMAAPPAPKIANIEEPVPQVHLPQRVQLLAPVAEVAQPKAVPGPRFDSSLLTAPGPKVAAKIVATNTFEGGSSATPTLPKVPASKVQTGGFGDPNGVPVNAHGSNHGNIAAAGSFDLPQGAGYGNGTGGASGVRGTVASAGFGNGTAIQGAGGRGGNSAPAHVQSTSFGAAAPPAPSANPARQLQALNHSPSSAPVSIQSKPTPVYTAEARQLKVEGEVLLNVVFTADGQIRILNVVRGLGHGLDEAAQHAAQGIRFNPAMRDGRPVDSNATLHIVFQLS
jgi:TonB family protein